MIKVFSTLVSTAFYTLFLQNLVLCGGYGLSPLLRGALHPKNGFGLCAAVTWFSTVLSIACGYLFRVPALKSPALWLSILITGGLLLALACITLAAAKLFFRASSSTLRQLSSCAFNSLVMAVPLVNLRLANPLTQSIGVGLGAGLSFGLSVWLLSAGIRTLDENKHIPPQFRGIPGLLIYVGILSLAFMAILGRSFLA